MGEKQQAHDVAFYFANLGADVSRCVNAAQEGNEGRYQESLERAHRTLAYIRSANRPEAYEEALLMLRGLDLARSTPESLTSFQSSLASLISSFSARLVA